MRITKVKLEEIQFNTKDFDKALYESIKRIGFSFPIKLSIDTDNHYICVDGHKRLSALKQILKDDPEDKRGNDVPVIVVNNENTRSNDCWRGRNTH